MKTKDKSSKSSLAKIATLQNDCTPTYQITDFDRYNRTMLLHSELVEEFLQLKEKTIQLNKCLRIENPWELPTVGNIKSAIIYSLPLGEKNAISRSDIWKRLNMLGFTYSHKSFARGLTQIDIDVFKNRDYLGNFYMKTTEGKYKTLYYKQILGHDNYA
jgi:hypothetical protein